MRINSRPLLALILANSLLALAVGCTNDDVDTGDTTTEDRTALATESPSADPSLADLTSDAAPPRNGHEPESADADADAAPEPTEPEIPQVVKDAPVEKVIQQFPDKTPYKEFSAKIVGKGIVYHGLYTEYYQGGGKQKSGEYEYGRKNGEWTFWGKSGVVRKKGTYVDDKQHGEWQKYRDDGSLEWIERYDNGLTHGTWKMFREDGKTLVWERSYKHGARDGLWTNYHPDGSKGSVETYRDGKLNGPSKTWFENGTLSMEGEYVDDKRHGMFRAFGNTGNLKDEVEWENGRIKIGS